MSLVTIYNQCGSDRIANLLEKIMSELTELKASVAELKKDSQRTLDALTAQRKALADLQAALDALKANTNLSAEDRAAVDDIKAMVVDADNAIETAVPEVPAPPPVEAPPTTTV